MSDSREVERLREAFKEGVRYASELNVHTWREPPDLTAEADRRYPGECPRCHGAKLDPQTGDADCRLCGGTGNNPSPHTGFSPDYGDVLG